jgi:hypothetical protein
VSAFAQVSQIGDLLQPFKQTGQFAAQHRHLSGHRVLARLPLWATVALASSTQRNRCEFEWTK